MLVLDSSDITRIKKRNEIDAHRAQVNTWLETQARASQIRDSDDDPTNIAQRLGTPRSSDWLETRIMKIQTPEARSLRFETNWTNPKKKAIFTIQKGVKSFVCAYENGVMPEKSIFRRVYEDVLDSSMPTLSRADLTKHEYVPGEGFVFDDTVPRLGKKRVAKAWNEDLRGWRSVLIILVSLGYLTPTHVETLFGSSDSPEWARGMGKQSRAASVAPY